MRNGRGGTRAREFSRAVVRRAITARLAVLRTVAPAGADGDVGSIGVAVGRRLGTRATYGPCASAARGAVQRL